MLRDEVISSQYELRLSRTILLIASPLLIYLWFWWVGAVMLMEGEDKEFHLLALDYGVHKETEPLWGLIASGIGALFPEDPFGAAVVLVYLLFACGLLLNRFSFPSIPLVLFSPGLVYLASQALRQGTAMGCLLVSIGLLAAVAGRRGEPPGLKILIAPLILCSLIHNSIIIAAVWLLLSIASGALRRRNSFLACHLAALAVSTLLLVASPVEGLQRTAILLIGFQFAVMLHSMRASVAQHGPLLASLFFLFCVVGFTLTTTGLRVVIMLTILLPMVLKGGSGRFIVAGLIFYPVASAFLTGDGLEKLIPSI